MSSLILASNRARIRKESEARLSTGDASYQVDKDKDKTSRKAKLLILRGFKAQNQGQPQILRASHNV